MGAYGTDVAITAGSGTSVKTFTDAASDNVQVVREHSATAAGAPSPWTVTTAGSASQVAADVNRVGWIMVSAANGRVYLRFDSTVPNPATPLYSTYLDPGDRMESPYWATELAVSMVGAVAGGTILTTLFTAS